jgi:hypothetical protein
VVFSIPQALLLYGARAYEDHEYGPAARQLQQELGPVLLDQRSLLVLLLVLERARADASRFAPYIAMLPRCYGEWSGHHTHCVFSELAL